MHTVGGHGGLGKVVAINSSKDGKNLVRNELLMLTFIYNIYFVIRGMLLRLSGSISHQRRPYAVLVMKER